MLHARPLRLHARRQRHVLVVGPVGGRAAQRGTRLALHAVLGPIVGVVVVDLVVVPGDDPGTGGMRILQVRIAPVQRMARAVVLERIGLRRAVAAHVVAAPVRLVDVVAEEGDEVGVIGRDVPVGAEVPLLVLLAGGEGEAHAPAHLGRKAGAVRVRPMRLCASPAVNRYQYQRSGSSPSTSTWTECAHSGCASASPERSTALKASSAASSHFTYHGDRIRHRSGASKAQRWRGRGSRTRHRAKTDRTARAALLQTAERAPRVCRKRRRVNIRLEYRLQVWSPQ